MCIFSLCMMMVGMAGILGRCMLVSYLGDKISIYVGPFCFLYDSSPDVAPDKRMNCSVSTDQKGSRPGEVWAISMPHIGAGQDLGERKVLPRIHSILWNPDWPNVAVLATNSQHDRVV
jgi:hypothetical protein